MLSWIKSKNVASTPANNPAKEPENAPAPAIRKPQHAARDARMSIPVADREYQAILDARKRSRAKLTLGTTAINGNGMSNGMGKAFDSGFPSFAPSPVFSELPSHNSSTGDLGELWDAVSRQTSTAPTSVAESSKDALKRRQQQQQKKTTKKKKDSGTGAA